MTACDYGSYRSYRLGCRCTRCRVAASEYRRKERDRRRGQSPPDHVEHGKVSTYTNYYCRCDASRTAAVQAGREYRRRRKEAS